MKRIFLFVVIITCLFITLFILYKLNPNMPSRELATEKYLHHAFYTDYLKRINAKKVKLKFLTTSGVDEQFKKKLFHEAQKNLEIYSEITDVDFEIANPRNPSNAPQFVVIITDKNPAEITLLPSVRKLLYPSEKLKNKSLYPDEYQILKDKNKLFLMDLFHSVEHATSLGIFIMNVNHELVVDNEKRVFKEFNLAFFRFFSSYTQNNSLRSVASKSEVRTSLTPLDKSYLKAIYSEGVYTGMPIREAKEIIREQMLKSLHPYYGETDK